MAFKAKFASGDRVWYDGDAHRVEGLQDGVVKLRSGTGRLTYVTPNALLSADDFKLLDKGDYEQQDLVTFPDNAPDNLVKEAEKLLAHLREARTGYRSGNPLAAEKHEPREAYDPALVSMTQRMKSKAKELDMSVRNFYNYSKAYETYGLVGLVDQRALREKGTSSRINPRIREGILALFAELEQGSNISMKSMMRWVERWTKMEYPEEEIEMPSRPTFNALLKSLDQGRGIFGSTKNRQSTANRPETPYRQFTASRPGEVVIIDSTPLDAFAIDPITFKWVQVQLTLAYDLYTRSILDWRFTPKSVKGVDAALLLFGIIKPKMMREGWPENARWPYVGVPENVVIELLQTDAPDGLANGPIVNPEAVVIDRGKVFLSQAFIDGCKRLGISIQLAHPYTPTDKAHIESVFKTIRLNFVENLKGYKGPDLFSRGKDVESDAFYFIDEIERYFAEWVATFWHKRHHRGLLFPEVPRLHLSPNDLYEEGIAKAGFLYIVPDQRLYYELLPTEWRTVQHYGVEVSTLVYDGDILNDYRDVKSPYLGKPENEGKWPIRYDPRDKSEVYFYDPSLDKWHTLYWTGALYPNRPFDDSTLAFAKLKVKERGGNPRNQREVEAALNELLNRMDDHVFKNEKERKLAAKRAIQAQLSRSERPSTALYSLLGPDDEAHFGGVIPTGKANFEVEHDPIITEEDLRETLELFKAVSDFDDDDDLGF